MSIAFNPFLTTVAQNTFTGPSSYGLVQGTAYPDPAIRYKQAGGYLASTETLPIWGGVGIYTDVPGTTGQPPVAVGPQCGRAASLTGSTALTAFSVFDQAYGMVNSPQSPVPLAGNYGQVMYYRLGSGARIAVACDPALVSLQGGLTTAQVSWDFAQQRLIPYVAAYAANVITAASWASTNGGTATLTSTSAHGLSVGSDFTVTGITPAAYNGTFKAITGTTGSTIVYLLPLASTPGAGSAFGTLVAGGGALPCSVLDIQNTNCQTVTYNTTTGFATWNYNGSAAVILI